MKKFNLEKHNFKGKLIVFEGIDGAGKSTLLQKAQEFLEQNNKQCHACKMPSDRMRNLSVFKDYDNSNDDTTRHNVNLVNLTIMVSGDRLITLDTEIIPALKEGKYVLCDRYCYTGYVRCSDDIIFQIAQRFVEPDLVILAQVTAKTAKSRVQARTNEIQNFYDDLGIIQQIKDFNTLAKLNNFITINTEQEQNKIDEHLLKALYQIK